MATIGPQAAAAPAHSSDPAHSSQDRAPVVQPSHRIVIAATFTAEPIAEVIRFWAAQIGRPVELTFAGYNQVFQQLLEPASDLSRNQRGMNLLLVRPEDWLRHGAGAGPSAGTIERGADDLRAAVQAAQARARVPLVVMLPDYRCPDGVDDELRQKAEAVRVALAADLSAMGDVRVVRADEIAAVYPIEDVFDDHTDEVAHVPFTARYFAALGTLAVRRWHGVVAQPIKVIVLDCDQTLWRGVVGEDGVLGVKIDPSRWALQQSMLEQHRAGRLLCLASKNVEKDVLDVLDEHPEMLLRREHITGHRINWQSKSANVLELARELNLGLDAFVFIDDNPVECAEMRANLPEVLTVQITEDNLAATLRHLWPLDIHRVTDADRQRAEQYRQQARRQEFRRQVLDIGDFIKGLGVEVEISPLREADIDRVAQLTQRTNQFNATTIRMTTSEVQRLGDGGSAGGRECVTIRVRDRFGDYGLVGAAFFATRGDAVVVENLLLSCRVLGRGVEYQIVRHLGSLAAARGKEILHLEFVPSARNQPVRDFLERIGGEWRVHRRERETGAEYLLPAAVASELAYAADEQVATEVVDDPPRPSEPATDGRRQRLLTTLVELDDVDAMMAKVAAWSATKQRPVSTEYVAPRNDLEAEVAKVYAEILGLDRVGVEDNFFELGGDSFMTLRVRWALGRALGLEVPLHVLLDSSTVGEAAVALGGLDGVAARRPAFARTPLGRRDASVVAPATVSQFPYIFQWTLSRSSDGETLATDFWLDGNLSVDALKAAVKEIVRRQAALRTHFVSDMKNGRFLLVEEPPPEVSPLEVVSGVADDGVTTPQQAQALMSRLTVGHALDLTKGPVSRYFLMPVAERRFLLRWLIHHVASDGRSAYLFARELAALYSAYAKRQPSPLSELRVQFADFASWQTEWRKGPELSHHIAFWKQQMQPRPSPLAVGERAGDVVVKDILDGAICRALSNVSATEQTTLFGLLQAILAVAVARACATQDVVLGVLNANRVDPQLIDVIGCFADVVPVRTNLRVDATLRDVVRQIRNATWAAIEHGEIPLSEIVRTCKVQTPFGPNGLIDVLINFQTPPESFATDDLIATVLPDHLPFLPTVEAVAQPGPGPRPYGDGSARTSPALHLKLSLTAEGMEVNFDTPFAAGREIARLFRSICQAVASEPRQLRQPWSSVGASEA